MSEQESDGQVSEVAAMDPAEADQPISPGDSTAGYPDSESGETQGGSKGPGPAPDGDSGADGDASAT